MYDPVDEIPIKILRKSPMSSSNTGGKRPGSWDGPPAQAPPNRKRRGPELEPGELEPGEIEPAGYCGGGSRGGPAPGRGGGPPPGPPAGGFGGSRFELGPPFANERPRIGGPPPPREDGPPMRGGQRGQREPEDWDAPPMGGGKGGGGGRGPPRADLPPSASAVKEAKAAASRAHKEALAAGGFPKRLVTWARATVLETLNAPATRSTLLDAVHREGAHAPAFRELHALLERTVDGIENVSTLLVGPRGCGKHRLLSAVLRQMPTPDRGPEHEDDEEELAFHRVDLHALLVPDEPTALMAIASQLRVAHGGMTMRGSFCDGLRYLLHLLRRARPGCEGEGAVEAQGRPVLFVLHDFEQFTFRPKQTLVCYQRGANSSPPSPSLSYPLSSFPPSHPPLLPALIPLSSPSIPPSALFPLSLLSPPLSSLSLPRASSSTPSST